jgi:hypothetical protein
MRGCVTGKILCGALLCAFVCASSASDVADGSAVKPPGDTMAADTVKIFPEVRGRSLERREFRLPGDFEGDVNLVLVAFRREHQSLVDTWLPAAAALAETRPGLRYYELPVIGSGYALFRGLIDGGMRSGIPDRAARARTITLYLDKAAFRDALGLPDEETIYALVLGPDGRVAATVEGAYSMEKGRAVERAVDASVAGTGARADDGRTAE